MSLSDGLAALQLQMPPRVPRTEYSVEMHYDLVAAMPIHKQAEPRPSQRAWLDDTVFDQPL